MTIKLLEYCKDLKKRKDCKWKLDVFINSNLDFRIELIRNYSHNCYYVDNYDDWDSERLEDGCTHTIFKNFILVSYQWFNEEIQALYFHRN